MKQLLLLCILGTAFCWACQPEDEILAKEAVSLQFEQDSIQFDTLFTTEQSITRRFRVYNPSDQSVLIEQIALERGAQSPYTLYVNGQAGTAFGEQLLLAGDSLLLLLEARLPETSDTLPYLASDQLVFLNKGLRQEVAVVGYGQNALFVSDTVIACNSVWDSPLPYVIENSLLVDSLCTLRIQKGSRLYFKPDAHLYVKGSLLAEGDSAVEERILFRNHRLDPYYENQPGQWGGLIFLPGSSGNLLSFCDIRNAEYGIYLGTPDEDAKPDLELANCRIENTLRGGIVAYTSDLLAVNTLVNTSAQLTVANLAGGNFIYRHCTFANFFSQREDYPVLLLSDKVVLADGSVLSEPLWGLMENSIVWGSRAGGEELLVDNTGAAEIELEFLHNLLRTTNPAFAEKENIVGTDRYLPAFRNIELYDYRLDSLSPAIDAGVPSAVQLDLEGQPRDSQPDIGAYEYAEPVEDE